MSAYIIQHTRECLLKGTPAVFEIDGVGKLLIVGLFVNEERDSVWVAVGIDGRALKFLDLTKPIDVFELVEANFPLHIAQTVAEFAVSLLSLRTETVISDIAKQPLGAIKSSEKLTRKTKK